MQLTQQANTDENLCIPLFGTRLKSCAKLPHHKLRHTDHGCLSELPLDQNAVLFEVQAMYQDFVEDPIIQHEYFLSDAKDTLKPLKICV